MAKSLLDKVLSFEENLSHYNKEEKTIIRKNLLTQIKRKLKSLDKEIYSAIDDINKI